MYSSIPALDTAQFNSINGSICLSPSLSLSLRKRIAEAARTGPNMTEADKHDLADEPDLIQEPTSNTAAIVAPVPVQQSAQSPNFAEVMEIAAQDIAKGYVGKSPEEIRKAYPTALGERVIAIVQSQTLTAQQATAKFRRAVRAAAQEYGKDLKAAGVKPMQHSVQDFVHVIYTQLELQRNGENPSANAVLHLAFPDNLKKAERIGKSKRVQRVQEAFNSPAIQNHPVEKAMVEQHGQRNMNLRTQTQQFSQSIAVGVVLFEDYHTITKLKTQVAEQDFRISTLEQKAESTTYREALDDAGATTSEEKVLTLYAQGKRQREIARLLNMKLDAVKYHLKKLPKQA